MPVTSKMTKSPLDWKFGYSTASMLILEDFSLVLKLRLAHHPHLQRTERNILGVTYYKHFICSLLVTQWEQKSWKNRLLTSK